MKSPIPFVTRLDHDATRAWLAALAHAMPDETVVHLRDLPDVERVRADVAIVADPEPDDLARLPGLAWVHSVWAGVERLLAALPDDGPELVRLVDPQLARTMAEAALAWTLYLHRDMPAYARQQANGIWRARDYVPPERRQIAVLGLGELGAAAARTLAAARFKVSGWSRTEKHIENIETRRGDHGLRTVLGDADIVICLLPLTPATHGLIDARRLRQLRPGAAIINFARGRVIDTGALLAALDTGTLEHAVLDVFDEEPLPPDSPLWRHPAVTVLPHIAGPTDLASAAKIVADNIAAYRARGVIPPAVDVSRGY